MWVGFLRYNKNEQALWARNATAEACIGPVRVFVCRDGLTGRSFALTGYRWEVSLVLGSY